MSIRTRGRRWSRRRLALAGIARVSVALAVGSVALACTPVIGNTYFSDGNTVKSGSSGSALTAYAAGAQAGKQHLLVAGAGGPGHDDHACMFNSQPLNPNMRVANFRGFIPYTSGVINRAPGNWQICFAQSPLNENRPGTQPIFFTVI